MPPAPPSSTRLSHAQMEALAEAVASKVVEEMLTKLGIDHSRPLEVQHDFKVLREMRTCLTSQAFQADLAYLRKWRLAMESGAAKGALTIMAMITSGIAALIVLGFKAWMDKL